MNIKPEVNNVLFEYVVKLYIMGISVSGINISSENENKIKKRVKSKEPLEKIKELENNHTATFLTNGFTVTKKSSITLCQEVERTGCETSVTGKKSCENT